jgi:hypothetical protein
MSGSACVCMRATRMADLLAMGKASKCGWPEDDGLGPTLSQESQALGGKG